MRKVLVFIVMAAVLAVALTGCSVTEFTYYENFYDEMDIVVRFDDYFRKYGENDTSAFFLDELLTLREDLSFLPDECGEKSAQVNDYFTEAAESLIEGEYALRDGDSEKAQTALDNARLCFDNGVMRYNDFVAEQRH